jgi:hypothetical protein
MNEQNKKPRELLLYYTPIYNVVIQNWLFSLVERTLITLFASYQKNGCELSREVLKRHCECGPYHLERAVKRLEFMGIVAVKRGGKRSYNPPRRDTNRYFFQNDPYSWRVTKELQDRIAEETVQLGKAPRTFTHKGYADKKALDYAFGNSVPAYACGKKGRRKLNQARQSVENTAEVPGPTTDETKWISKSQKITADDVRFSYVAREYYRYIDDMKTAGEFSDHGFSSHQLTYFERLYAVFKERRRRPHENDIEIFNKIADWLNENKSNLEISNELGRLDQKIKKDGSETEK